MYRTIHYEGLTMRALKLRIQEIEDLKEVIIDFKIITHEDLE